MIILFLTIVLNRRIIVPFCLIYNKDFDSPDHSKTRYYMLKVSVELYLKHVNIARFFLYSCNINFRMTFSQVKARKST